MIDEDKKHMAVSRQWNKHKVNLIAAFFLLRQRLI